MASVKRAAALPLVTHGFMAKEGCMRSGTNLVVVLIVSVGIGGCSPERPTVAESTTAHRHIVATSSLSPSEVGKALARLRMLTAKWHQYANAAAEGYAVAVGCIDERVVAGTTEPRGMGFHFANPALLGDDAGSLYEPELVIYIGDPTTGIARLAGFDYFIPASATWPSPGAGGTAPILPELGLPYTWSAVHNGWMLHAWPWRHNPDGMFDNFNPEVPLCPCQLDPQTPACTP
jgi:hypothetical protein